MKKYFFITFIIVSFSLLFSIFITKTYAAQCSCAAYTLCFPTSVMGHSNDTFTVNYNYCDPTTCTCGNPADTTSYTGSCSHSDAFTPNCGNLATGGSYTDYWSTAICSDFYNNGVVTCNGTQSCPSGYTMVTPQFSDVGIGELGEGYYPATCQPIPNCSSGKSCNTCSGGTQPTNTCGYTTGSQSCSYNATQPCYTQYFTQSCSPSYYSNCSTNYTCPSGAGYQQACVTSLTVQVVVDYNHNSVKDGSDYGLSGVTVGDGSTLATTNSSGNAIFYNLTTGSYRVTITVPAGYQVVSGDPQTVTLSNTYGNATTYVYITPLYSISGHVYIDYNHDGVQNNNEPNYLAGISVTDGTDTTTTDANGNFTLPQDLISGTYTVSLPTIPSGYKGVITSQSVSVGPSNGATALSITPLYQIQGFIFNDANLNLKYDTATETAYTNGSHIKITGTSTGTVSTTADAVSGSYQTSQTLPSGTYTVAYDTGTTPLPTGYRFTTPSSWQVTLGTLGYTPSCNVGASLDGQCVNPNNGSISSLNFGVTNEIAWKQPICSDAIFNSGYSENIPSTASCGGTSAPYAIMNTSQCTTNPGILFSGSTNPYYGQGTGASTANYLVGDFLFPQLFNNQIPNTSATSYSFVNTSLNTYSGTTTPLKNICPSLTNCVLSEATAGGVYTTTSADGPVSISISNVDGTYQLGKANYVFLIGGNLTLTSNVITQNGYSSTFISGGDIHVAGSVGESNWTSTSPDLEGFFSANNNFDIDAAYPAGQQCQANGQPLEKKLNIVGSVITNAGGTGGIIVNNRDGCLQDLSCPALTVTSNPVMILNASGLLKPPYTFWQEQNP